MCTEIKKYIKRILAAGAAAVLLLSPAVSRAEETAAPPAEPAPAAEPVPAAEPAPVPSEPSGSGGDASAPAVPADPSGAGGGSEAPAPAAAADSPGSGSGSEIPAPAASPETSGSGKGQNTAGDPSGSPAAPADTASETSGAKEGASVENAESSDTSAVQTAQQEGSVDPGEKADGAKTDTSGKNASDQKTAAQKARTSARYYYGRSYSSGVAADKSASQRKIRKVLLTDETEQCLRKLNRLKKQDDSSSGKKQEDRVETIGGWELSVRDEKALRRLLDETDKAGCHLGLVMIDIRTGQGIAVNAKRKFYGASSIKGPFIVSLTALYPQTLEKQKNAFKAVTVNSDNGAYSSLVRTYGRRFYDAWREAAGAEASLTEGDYARLSAEDLARLWLLNYQYFTLNPVYGEPLGELFETPNRSAIKTVVGNTCTTRTKGGWIAEKNNTSADAGIVYAGEYPYILALVSDYPSDLKKLEPYVALVHRLHMDMVGGRTEKKRAREYERE